MSRNGRLKAFLLRFRRDAYRGAFEGAAGRRTLADLARFCHARKTVAAFDEQKRLDPLGSAQLEGRRQVWLRIQEALHLTEADLEAIAREGDTGYGGPQP